MVELNLRNSRKVLIAMRSAIHALEEKCENLEKEIAELKQEKKSVRTTKNKEVK